MKIVIIDDLQTNLDFFHDILISDYEIETYTNPYVAISKMLNAPPDLVLVDCVMPGMDGHEVIVRIKEDFPKMPIIMITGYRLEENLLKAMDLMVDDFIYKPISAEELLARVRSKILKSKKQISEQYVQEEVSSEEIEFDDFKETVIFNKQHRFKLKAKEYRLLKYLVKRKNHLVTRDEIFVNVWDDIFVSPATLDTHMCQLRKRLDHFGESIVTKKNTGFIFSTDLQVSH